MDVCMWLFLYEQMWLKVGGERLCRKAGIRRVWCVSVENGRVYVVVFV